MKKAIFVLLVLGAAAYAQPPEPDVMTPDGPPAPPPKPATGPWKLEASQFQLFSISKAKYAGPAETVGWEVVADAGGVTVRLVEVAPKRKVVSIKPAFGPVEFPPDALIVIGTRPGVQPGSLDVPDLPSVLAFGTTADGKPARGRSRIKALGVEKGRAKTIVEIVVDCGPPPDPNDPLFPALKTAFQGEPAASRQDDVRSLANVYRSLAETGVVDPDVKTTDQLTTLVANARKARVQDRLASVRKVVGDEFNKAVPLDPVAALTKENKAAVVALFTRIATLLEALS